MILKTVQIAHPVLDELRPHELPARVPQLAVRREDAVAEEIAEVGVEVGALAVVGELRRQHGLDVVGLRGEDDFVAGDVGFGCPGADAAELAYPVLEVAVSAVFEDAVDDEVDAWCFVLVLLILAQAVI